MQRLADPPLERIGFLQDQLRFGRDERAASDRRDDLSIRDRQRSFKHAANDALLPPDLAWLYLAVGIEASKLGARSRTARRAVIRFARTEHEVAAVVHCILRWAEQFDVIDLAAARAGDGVLLQHLANVPRVAR